MWPALRPDLQCAARELFKLESPGVHGYTALFMYDIHELLTS